MPVLATGTYGISTIPATSVGVISIGDVVIELNNVSIQWQNVYDNTHYVCTALSVTGVSLVTERGFSIGGVGNGVPSVLQVLLGKYYSSSSNIKSVVAPLRDIKMSLYENNLWNPPSSSLYDTASGPFSAMGLNKHKTRGSLASTKDPSMAVIPPASFSLRILPNTLHNIMSHPIPGRTNTIESFATHCGIYIPGYMMFRPIEVIGVTIDDFMGENTFAIGITVRVYFCNNPITPGFGDPDRWRQPAYHKWSVGSTWNVGMRPRIIINGTLMSRSVSAGPPSIYEFLPRAVPGMTLVALSASSSSDGMSTTYQAIYEVDYTTPIFFSNNTNIMSQTCANSANAIAYVDVVEDAQSVVQGSAAIQVMYENAINKMSHDAENLSDLAGIHTNVMTARRDAAIANHMLGYAKAESDLRRMQIIQEGMASGISGGLTGAGVGGAIGSAVGSVVPGIGTVIGGVVGTVAGGIAGSGLSTAANAIPMARDFNDAMAAYNRAEIDASTAHLRARLTEFGGQLKTRANVITRYAQQTAADMRALDLMSNSIMRTATINVIGFPGADVAALQLAAYTIAKQIYLGWLALASPPMPRSGFIVRGVLNTDLLKKLSELWNSLARSSITSFTLDSSKVVPSQNTSELWKILKYGLGGNIQTPENIMNPQIPQDAISVLRGLGVISTNLLESGGQAKVDRASLDEYNRFWSDLMDYIQIAYTHKPTYSEPRMTSLLTPMNLVRDHMGSSVSGLMAFGADDLWSLALSLLGIRSVKVHVSVRHQIPSVTLNLIVVFNNIEYQANVALGSLWRVFGDSIAPLEEKSLSGNKMIGLAPMIPFVVPITNTGSYSAYLKAITGLLEPYGQNKFLQDFSKEKYGTFIGYYDLSKMSNNDKDKLLDVFYNRNSASLGIYTHGASTGNSLTTPTITISYGRPGNYDYKASLGGGLPTMHLGFAGSFAGMLFAADAISSLPRESITQSIGAGELLRIAKDFANV